MFARLFLAAALFAPQASAMLHAFEVARAEANHPVCAAGPSAHIEPTSGHEHHHESDCAQCPRPPQAGVQAGPDSRVDGTPSFIREDRRTSVLLAVPTSFPPRGPPAA